VTQVEQPTMEFLWVEEVVSMVEYPAVTAAGASTALDTALVLASNSSPSPSLAG
jgi:hypothetical protein